MAILTNILPWAQIVLAALLTACILLQRSAEGLGGALGGGDMAGGVRYTRRGFEKFLFYTTIVIAVLFAATALVSILIK